MCLFWQSDRTAIRRIEKQLNRLERMMSDAQTHLDTAVASINEAVGNVVTEIADLKAAVEAGGAVDFTSLDAAVSGLQASTDVVESGETPPVTP